MVHPPYHPSSGELSVLSAFVLITLLAILVSSLYFSGRKYRFWKRHPEPGTQVLLRRAACRCMILSILLGVILLLGVWRFLPLSLDRAAELESQSLSAQLTMPASENDPSSPSHMETGALSPEDAAPLLDTLNHIVLRRDFRNLLPLEVSVDTRLLGGQQAVITLTGADGGQQVLTFYGTQLLTLESGGHRLCYHFYEPEHVEQLFSLLALWQERPLTGDELALVNLHFAPPDQPGIYAPLCGLTASWYASPEQLELGAFLRSLKGTPAVREDLEEIRRLGGSDLLEDPSGWTRHEARTVSGQLELYTGIWLDELEYSDGILFSPEEDCYYIRNTDAPSAGFYAGSGTISHTQVTLFSDDAVLVLKPEGRRWLIHSHLPR